MGSLQSSGAVSGRWSALQYRLLRTEERRLIPAPDVLGLRIPYGREENPSRAAHLAGDA